MADSGGIPKWLLDSKEHISRSSEWSNFVEELYSAIEQQLKESHVEAFSDLKHAEREFFMQRAVKAVQGGQHFKNMYLKVSVSLDQHLNNEVARQLLEDSPINTKTDLVLDCAQDGAVMLLQKWPDMKHKLHIYFNQPLPTSLRQLTWRLFLDDVKVRQEYVNLLKSNPRKAISHLDMEISQICERLIKAEPTFIDIKGSVGAFYAMKAVLSYHHALKKTEKSLIDVDYMLAVPFVVAMNNKISRRDPAPAHMVATLVVEYLTFMEGRPGCVVCSGSDDHKKEYDSYIEKVKELLTEEKDKTKKEIKTKTITALAERFKPSGIHKDRIVATDKGRQMYILGDGLSDLLRPIIRSMFVGYLKMEVVLFLWDQYMIGTDCRGFHDDYLPRVTVIFLLLLHESIKNAPPDEPLGKVLKENGMKLTVPQFQYEIHKYYFKDLFARLNQDNRAAVPVLDPTQSLHPPWKHWFNDMIPKHTTPQDRRLAREEREKERQGILLQQQERERQQYLDDIVTMKREKADYDRSRDEDNAHYARMKNDLELALEEERMARQRTEQTANAEIERLRKEVDALKHARPEKPKTANAYSRLDSRISRYLIPPPPTRATHPPTPVRGMKLPTPTPSPGRSPAALPETPQRQTEDVIKKFIKRVSASFNIVAHGNRGERDEMDAQTKEDIERHHSDIKHAEKAVFGRELRPGEFERLEPEEQDVKADEIMAAIKKRIEERRRAEIRAGEI